MIKDYWNSIYMDESIDFTKQDNWLDTYFQNIDFIGKTILDLGCGIGNNFKILKKLRSDVFACDLSKSALIKIQDKRVFNFDLMNGLPIKENRVDIIVADLCLHYFSKERTNYIVNEIIRVLKSNGYLIFRVNSINDSNFGANNPNNKEIERHFYSVYGMEKRFFSKDDVLEFFKGFEALFLEEKIHKRYEKDKLVFEGLFKIKK